uniref:hypothetical protein n=1 Tax=Fulvivirga sp. TaxID=1931237 RepID=UPI00404B08CC
MLEIIVMITLGKSIQNIIREKGFKPLKYILIMILMWFGLEFIGGILGVILFGEGLIAYPFALAGAALGGYLSYQIALNASPSETIN